MAQVLFVNKVIAANPAAVEMELGVPEVISNSRIAKDLIEGSENSICWHKVCAIQCLVWR